MTSFDESFNQALSGRKYDILTGRTPNFREMALHMMKNAYEKIIKPILDRININIPDSAFGTNAELLRNIFILVAAVLFTVSLFFIIKKLKRRSYRNKTIEEIFESLKENSVTYEKLLKDAEGFALKGQYREAIRYEYISLLWVLNSYSVIYLTDYKTNSQLKREILKNAAVFHDRFSNVVNIFNISWFGHKKISEETYRANRNDVNNLIREAHVYEKAT